MPRTKTTKNPAAPAADPSSPAAIAAVPSATPASAPAAASAPARPLAPDFALEADDGSIFRLSEHRGQAVVLYFYPKDNTPGCTREACAFQQSLADLAARGALVVGVSRDSRVTHQGFKKKQGLTFPLLTDKDAAVHRLFGAWGEKTMYGRTSEGALRTTVIIDAEGRLARVFRAVKVDGHAGEVLGALAPSAG
jgi:peroxiredoxin Q/BCP